MAHLFHRLPKRRDNLRFPSNQIKGYLGKDLAPIGGHVPWRKSIQRKGLYVIPTPGARAHFRLFLQETREHVIKYLFHCNFGIILDHVFYPPASGKRDMTTVRAPGEIAL